jgi:type III secretion protein J
MRFPFLSLQSASAGWRRLACAVIGFAAVLLMTACSSRVDLLASIAEADANEVIAALAKAGISADKIAGKEGMVGIQVDKSQSARAVDVLRSQGLPKEQFAGLGQVFQKTGLISSPLEERARYLAALSQDLSATLTRIDGVLFARVHLVLPERGQGTDSDIPSSAAVFIKHQSDVDLEVVQPQVRRLVVNSIPDLATERVSVVLIPSAVTKSTAKNDWSTFLGYRVEPSAAQNLGLMMSGLALVCLLALAAAGFMAWRYILVPRQRAAAADARGGGA